MNGIERRRHPRRAFPVDLQGVYVDSEGRRVMESLHGVDISQCGLGVESSRPHEVGTHFVISLPGPKGWDRHVHARVVRCWQEDATARLGLEFNDSPTELRRSLSAA